MDPCAHVRFPGYSSCHPLIIVLVDPRIGFLVVLSATASSPIDDYLLFQFQSLSSLPLSPAVRPFKPSSPRPLHPILAVSDTSLAFSIIVSHQVTFSSRASSFPMGNLDQCRGVGCLHLPLLSGRTRLLFEDSRSLSLALSLSLPLEVKPPVLRSPGAFIRSPTSHPLFPPTYIAVTRCQLSVVCPFSFSLFLLATHPLRLSVHIRSLASQTVVVAVVYFPVSVRASQLSFVGVKRFCCCFVVPLGCRSSPLLCAVIAVVVALCSTPPRPSAHGRALAVRLCSLCLWYMTFLFLFFVTFAVRSTLCLPRLFFLRVVCPFSSSAFDFVNGYSFADAPLCVCGSRCPVGTDNMKLPLLCADDVFAPPPPRRGLVSLSLAFLTLFFDSFEWYSFRCTRPRT
jgi:hypothetical protein